MRPWCEIGERTRRGCAARSASMPPYLAPPLPVRSSPGVAWETRTLMDRIRFCDACGKDMEWEATACPSCAARKPSPADRANPQGREVPCPFCAEPVLAAAKKCRHCGEWIVKQEPAATTVNPVDRVIEEIMSDPVTASLPASSWPVVCTVCKCVDQPKIKGPSSLMPVWFVICAVAGMFMWYFFVLAVLCAVSWGMRKKTCAACGSDQVIPLDSPRARELFQPGR